jgi:muconolactone D-isomerase
VVGPQSLAHAATGRDARAAISSLPLWPWMDVTVHPLAEHPNDPGR